MIIENTEIYGFKAALRAMRNPWDSWDKSDSFFNDSPNKYEILNKFFTVSEMPFIGEKDSELMKKLCKKGTEHRKFLRHIVIWTDITAPLYFMTELDTYKVGITRSSCSTMHKLGSRLLTENDFEDNIVLPETLKTINDEIANNKRKNLLFLKQILPSNFLIKSTLTLNYEVCANIFKQRHNHKLPEWNINSYKYSFCKWIKDLPYSEIFLTT
jgi:hypothetical protein